MFQVIRIPDGRGYKEFVFSVTALPGDPSGSNDCIKQARNGWDLGLTSFIFRKWIILASIDIKWQRFLNVEHNPWSQL